MLFVVSQQVYAAAATAYGFGGRRSLLALRDLSASIYLEYEFDRSDTENKKGNRRSTSNYSHVFTEEVSVGGRYSLYKPQIWRGSYKVTLGADQVRSYKDDQDSGRTSNYLQSYEFYGDLFQVSQSPVFLKSILNDRRVSRRYAEDYYQWSSTHLATMNILNRTLPSTLNFSDSETETDGLVQDRRISAQAMSLSISHRLLPFMTTSAGYLKVDRKEENFALNRTVTNDKSVSNISNTLTWPYGRFRLSLESQYRYSEETGTDNGRERFWEETLEWIPGRALRAELVHTDRDRNFNDVSSQDVMTRGSLTYFLYHSLSVALYVSDMERTFQDGTQDNQSLATRLTYKKNLYRGRFLSVTSEYTQEDVDRNVSSASVPVLGEVLTVDVTSVMLLANTNVDTSTVVVRDSTQTVTYIEGADYVLYSFGVYTEISILPGSAISDGDQLSINYSYMVDPSVSYEEWRSYISSVLSLYHGKLKITGRYSRSNKDQKSGAENIFTLNSMTLYSIGVAGRLNPFHFDLRYTDTDTSIYQMEQYEAFAGYETHLSGGQFLVDCGGVYHVYRDVIETTSTSITSRALYRKRLTRRSMLNTEAEAKWVSGSGPDRKIARVEVGVNTRYRKTIFTADIEAKYLDYETRRSWSENFRVSMRRNF